MAYSGLTTEMIPRMLFHWLYYYISCAAFGFFAVTSIIWHLWGIILAGEIGFANALEVVAEAADNVANDTNGSTKSDDDIIIDDENGNFPQHLILGAKLVLAACVAGFCIRGFALYVEIASQVTTARAIPTPMEIVNSVLSNETYHLS